MYSAYNGSALDCGFEHFIQGLTSPYTDAENNGGHFYDYNSRPFSYENKPIEYSADTFPADGLIVKGKTLSTPPRISAILIHYIPTVSGNIFAEGFITLPNGWVCARPCYTRSTWRHVSNYKVAIRGLEELPPPTSTDSYVLFRNPIIGDDINHPDAVAFYGAPETVQLLPLIAENYFLLRGKKLSINDISLINGGVFDVNSDFSEGAHASHREGKDVDINRDFIDCLIDTDLFLAVDSILPPLTKKDGTLRIENGKPTAIYCESRGRKHIDFEI